MKRKEILNILQILIVILFMALIINTPKSYESFTNIRKPEGHEHEYIVPILRLIYPTINFIDDIDSSRLLLLQKSIPVQNTKPYLLMNGEPNVKNDPLYRAAVNDPLCVGCIVKSMDYSANDKTFYVPMFLDRGHTIFTSSPFIRKYNSEGRNRLAAYIATHSPPHRDEFFKSLRYYDKTVDGLGAANHTKDINIAERKNWWDTVDIYKDYKFGFAMENKNEDGYITEKIMNVYIGGAIPLYWGTSKVKTIFNPKSFVYLNDFKTLNHAAKYVVELSKNTEKLKEMYEASIFLENTSIDYSKYYDIPAPEWVLNISNKIKANLDTIKN